MFEGAWNGLPALRFEPIFTPARKFEESLIQKERRLKSFHMVASAAVSVGFQWYTFFWAMVEIFFAIFPISRLSFEFGNHWLVPEPKT